MTIMLVSFKMESG